MSQKRVRGNILSFLKMSIQEEILYINRLKLKTKSDANSASNKKICSIIKSFKLFPTWNLQKLSSLQILVSNLCSRAAISDLTFTVAIGASAANKRRTRTLKQKRVTPKSLNACFRRQFFKNGSREYGLYSKHLRLTILDR